MKWYRNSNYTIYNADSLKWLRLQRAKSFHAVVTDPPFGFAEYTAGELNKRRKGRGGIWRLPNSFDEAKRQPVPRFTVMSDHDRMGVLAFHLRLAPELFRVLVPGAHVMVSSQCLVSHLVAQAFCLAGFEARGQIVRAVSTLRGGDRPKFGHKEYRDLSVIPRSCFEPWLLFRKPCKGLVIKNLRRFGTGALRRPSENTPFSDFLKVSPARRLERSIANHPSLKPQALMRRLVRACLPLGRGVILDPFMGAGSTIAAAKALGLRSVGVEMDAKYFSMAKSAIPKLAELNPTLNDRDGERNVRRKRLGLPASASARK
jgi:DNA modification methylase